MFPTRTLLLDSHSPANALLSLEEPEALQSAINALEPEEAALAISQAPSLEEKSRLVWAMAPARRRAALDRMHPGMVGALIQNREAENKALLGDLSRDQFARLLHYCSPEQAYYWLALAASLENPRANMLPLLVPIEQLASALLTRPQFVLHCQEVGDYSVGDFHLDLQDELLDIVSATVTVYGPEGVIEEFPILDDLPARDPRLRRLLHTLEHRPDHYSATVTVISAEGDLEEIPLRDPRLRRLLHKLLDYDLEQYSALLNLFGPEGVLREFPIRDPGTRRLVKRVLDHDTEQYVALIQAALELYDYEGGHPEEREILNEAPVVLDELLTVEEERQRAGLAAQRLRDDPPAGDGGPLTNAARPANAETDQGEEDMFLSRSPLQDPGSPVHALLSLQEEVALQAAINALEPEEAALAIGQAPSLEEKSRLVWALAPDRRAEVLDRLHPGFVGALIQNREAENKALLGDLSREQFTRLLRYCSPERAYYWLTLTTSFEDARAAITAAQVRMAGGGRRAAAVAEAGVMGAVTDALALLGPRRIDAVAEIGTVAVAGGGRGGAQAEGGERGGGQATAESPQRLAPGEPAGYLPGQCIEIEGRLARRTGMAAIRPPPSPPARSPGQRVGETSKPVVHRSLLSKVVAGSPAAERQGTAWSAYAPAD